MTHFSAFVVRYENGQFHSAIETISTKDLSAGEVLIKVAYSSVNYKDSLAARENGGVIRDYPMIPGIDLSGEVIESADQSLSTGEQVLVTGYGLGVSHTGGFAEYARVPAEWVISLPKELSLKDAMIIGTAGLTAALCVSALEKQGLSQNKEAAILITGASGGVGTLSISILAHLGYKNIIALSQKEEAVEQLKQLGAASVIHKADFLPEKIKPLGKQIFDYAIDTTGGNITSALIPQISYNGSVAICGNAAGIQLSTTVLPFILRNISLLGIDSVQLSREARLFIWNRLATDMNMLSHVLVNEISLAELPETFNQLQQGQHLGRTIVKIS